ncbi:MAG: hypothetical protein QNI96_11900 [Woeseiaceae bacterium]|nr:hypothetical protein [Woeseiaceae bacterium]
MTDISKIRERLVRAGRLKHERDIELFDALAEHAPEMIAMIYAAALARITVTNEESGPD